jgi:hypothetical protein
LPCRQLKISHNWIFSCGDTWKPYTKKKSWVETSVRENHRICSYSHSGRVSPYCTCAVWTSTGLQITVTSRPFKRHPHKLCEFFHI